MLSELSDLVRRRQLSARELVAASLDRIERYDGEINSVVQTRGDQALAEAEAIDRALASGREPGPLAGLPILVKEADDVAGLPTTQGSRLLADEPPATSDGRIPALLRAAGGVIVGKSNIPEFCFEGHSSNPVFGATCNPWAPRYSPGGSSGGSGAALAAGLAAVATATDGGGSIRIPAAFCGLVGLKPTNGRVGRGGVPAWLDLTTDGPLAHSVADAGLLLSLVAGPAVGDIYAGPPLPASSTCLPTKVVVTPRISSSGPLPGTVADLFEAALKTLEIDLGLPVETVDGPRVLGGRQVDLDWFTISGTEQAHALGSQTIEDGADIMDPVFRETMRAALAVDVAEYVAARRRRWEYARAFDGLVTGATVLVSPTMNIDGFLADGRMPDDDPSTPVSATPSWAYNTNLANMVGAPAISLPAGRHANGVPFGLQVMAARYREDLLLGVAEAWERVRPWPRLAQGYTWFAD